MEKSAEISAQTDVSLCSLSWFIMSLQFQSSSGGFGGENHVKWDLPLASRDIVHF